MVFSKQVMLKAYFFFFSVAFFSFFFCLKAIIVIVCYLRKFKLLQKYISEAQSVVQPTLTMGVLYTTDVALSIDFKQKIKIN